MNRRLSVVALAAAALLAGCADEPAVPRGVPEPHESEFEYSWDEKNDEPYTAPEELTASELTDLLRIYATGANTMASCTPSQVDLEIQYMDAAMGHRFGRLTVTNTSATDCTVQGYPGFGARGEWGHKLLLKAEQSDPIDYSTDQPLVTLEPGESAYSNVEWTGSLGGAESEPISLFIIQLADAQIPIPRPVTSLYSQDAGDFVDAQGVPLPNTGFDISMDTTVRMGPFRTD